MAEKSSVPYDTISRLSVASQSLFTKCCCCVPLRIGCFVLGYLHLVMTCFQILGLILITTYIGVFTHGFDHFDASSDFMRPSKEYNYKFNQGVETPFDDEKDVQFLKQIGFVLAVLMIACTAWLIINIACLVGLHKRRPGPIRVYVGFATARLVLSIAGFIYVVMGNQMPFSQSLVTHIIDLCLTAYFILVYYIYAVQLEKEREAELAQPAPVNNVFLYPSKLDKSHLVA